MFSQMSDVAHGHLVINKGKNMLELQKKCFPNAIHNDDSSNSHFSDNGLKW